MKKVTTFEKHLVKQYGKKGTDRRDKFEADSIAFRLGEMLKEERTKAKLLGFCFSCSVRLITVKSLI